MAWVLWSARCRVACLSKARWEGAASGVTAVSKQPKKDARKSEANFWGQKTNKLKWCICGRRGVEVCSEDDLQNVLGSQVCVNTRIFSAFRAMPGIDITTFTPVGNAASISVEGQFDLACSSVMTLLKYGIRGVDLVADARCDAQLAPLKAAMDVARKGFRAELRSLQDILEKPYHREAMAAFPTKTFRTWAEDIALWICLNPPDSFDDFPAPPVPEFAAVLRFRQIRSYMVQSVYGKRSQGGRGQCHGRHQPQA